MRYLALFIMLFMWNTQSLAEAKESEKPTDISRVLKRCKACHGKDLHGKKKAPGLYNKGFSDVYVSLTSDVPKKMERIVKKMTEAEIWEVSRYISELGVTNDDAEKD